MRIKKKFSLIAVMAAFCLSIACAVAFISVDTRAFAADTATFEMVEGASVRLAENTGLRFIVKMDKTTAEKFTADNGVELKILISPEYYFDKITDGNYKNLAKKVEITVDKTKIYNGEGKDSEYYFANGVLANVKSQNYKIEFNAVAYYEENGQTVYSKIPSKNERSFYFVTNKAFIKDGVSYAKTILSLNAYSWYGEADAPITVANQEEYDSLVSVIKTAQLDLTGKTVARDYDETYHYTFKGLTADESGVKIPEFTAEEHRVQKWNTANASYDQAVCSCGKTLSEKFNKVVTDERQDVILSDDSHAITLGGISAYKAIKSIKYGDIDLGGDISALTIPEEMANAVHGEQTLTVVVTDNYGADHTVLVPVTIVTKVINDWQTLLYNCQYNSANSANNAVVFGTGKYYILGQDIEGSTVYSFSYGGTSYTITWGGYEKGFAGTLDGRNKTIKNVNVNNGGIFSALCGGTVKNVNLTVSEWSDGNNGFSVLASNVKDASLSNITITFNKVINLTNPGVLSGQQMRNTKSTNVTVYAYGSELGYLLGSAVHADNPDNVCENVTVYAKSLTKISPNQTKKDGVSVILTKELANNNDIILKDKDGDKTEFTVNLEEYADYTIKSVKFGASDLQFNGATVTISDEIKNGTHGANSLTVTAIKESATVILSVPVTIVTESVSTFSKLKELVQYKIDSKGKICEGKYYILAGDITVDSAYGYENASGKAEGNGFAGTLDGRGHSLIGGNMYAGGLFVSIEGGTIKNLKFSQVNPVGANRTLIAASIYNATIEDVEIKTYTVSVTLVEKQFFGVIASGRVINVTMNRVSIDMGNSTIPWVFGCGWNNANVSNYHCTDVTIKLKSLKCLAANSNDTGDGVGKTLANDAVSGITVITAA